MRTEPAEPSERRGPAVGEPAPPFRLAGASAAGPGVADLGALRGTAVVLVFFRGRW